MRFSVQPRTSRVMVDVPTIHDENRTLARDPTPQIATARAALLNLAATASWQRVEAMLAACKAVE